ncbi:MAG: addiction module antidote protein [Pseudomonadota bacterium]
MNKKIKISELSEFDAAEYLNNEEDVAAYLTTVLEENDPALLAAAIGDIARARGMSQVAKDSGIAREALYKALRPGSQPRFETISRVCAALGMRLVIEPMVQPAHLDLAH